MTIQWKKMTDARREPVTREQLELLVQQIWDLNDQVSGDAILEHDAAQRVQIRILADRLAESEEKLGVSVRWQKDEEQRVDELEQQLSEVRRELIQEQKHKTILRDALMKIACSNEPSDRDGMIDVAVDALLKTNKGDSNGL